MNEALDFPLPPTTSPFLAGPPLSSPLPPPVAVPAAPEVDELTVLRKKVAELERVVALAKTRVETLGAEKREALERALQLQAQLDAVQRHEPETVEPARTFDESVVAELLTRVAALEAIVAPSRAA